LLEVVVKDREAAKSREFAGFADDVEASWFRGI
jgi:hypothetical protein